ncbi:RagB/SusD family nutrient uptake outer membrane protein [Paraflavitalea speifideaquila]|uniref:RagB/SusD family nutrient uptake outer membrane protein n=1 Tax=Paraflavitalea speifideaquila TaxID=3076558 RepID=UPI003312FE54
MWRYAYKGIEHANWVIEKVPLINMNTERRDVILGEALFLRSFFHFTLARNFGDIIIRTTPSRQESDTYMPKSPKADVYRQIFKDLDEAVAKLPSYGPSTTKGRPAKKRQ